MSKREDDDLRVTVRLSAEQVRKLDALRGGESRPSALRRVLDAHAGGRIRASQAKPMGREDVRKRLESRARAGSAPAMRQLLTMVAEDENRAEVDRLNALCRDD